LQVGARGRFPLYLPIFAIAIAAGKASVSGRRILAALFGTFAGYGLAVGVNAVLTSPMSWHQMQSGAVLYTGDIMTGLMIAGSGIGLVASLFIREGTTRRSGGGRQEPQAHVEGDELARRQGHN
jgi:hypothetical protein